MDDPSAPTGVKDEFAGSPSPDEDGGPPKKRTRILHACVK
jgi:hypothetical protein